jgi:hypothetical protein
MNEDMILPDDFEMPTEETEPVEDTTPTDETEVEATRNTGTRDTNRAT